MRLSSSLFALSLLHSVRLASGREEIGLYGDLYGEIPRPTSEPLLSRDVFKHGAVLMETRLGYRRNGTSSRNFALGARQLPCANAGFVLSCPLTKELPCCPEEHPICCTDPLSTLCCSVGSFCNGLNTCCNDGQVACTNPEGCCPAGSICCGIWCCQKGFECRRDACVEQTRLSLLSVASESERSIADASSRSLESVASARSKSSESATSTGTTYSNGSGNATLVGGAVGGVLGAIALVLIGVFLCRRNRGARLTGRRPLFNQQPSSQPTTPASLTFPTNSNYIGGPPVTNTAQPEWHPPQFTPFTLSGGSTATDQISPALQQYASTPLAGNTWAPTIQQDNYGGPAFGSLPAEGSVDPRESYGNTLQGPTHSDPPMTFPYSAFGGASSPPPRYSTAPPVSETPMSEKT